MRNFTSIILTVLFTTVSFAAAQDDYRYERAANRKIVVQSASKEVVANRTLALASEYSYVDPTHIVPAAPLALALEYFKNNKASILNKNYITIADMSQHADKKRMYVIDMKTGTVSTYLVAHGKGSDMNNDGYADKFSNDSGSNMTSLGFYLAGETYTGAHGLSLRLYGLQRTNSNAYSRAIVMHGANYVNPTHTGRSFGCPAVEMKHRSTLFPLLKGKSLLYIYKK